MGFRVLAVAAAMFSSPLPANEANLDAVAAAPENHVILLENDHVRVLQVEVDPGEAEAIHSHRWPSVMHIQTPQPLLDILYREENGVLVEVRRQEIPLGQPPAAIWVSPEAPHSIKNLGTEPFRAIRVEMKQVAIVGK